MRDSFSLLGSLLVHGAILAVGSVLLVQKPEFSMIAAPNSMEVSLVAAPEEPVETPLEPEPEPPLPVVPTPDDVVIPEPPREPIAVPTPPRPEPPKPQPIVRKPRPTPSTTQGTDDATATASGGAEVTALPDYHRNPAPAYPERLRKLGIEGRVVLVVTVSPTGSVSDVRVKSASGQEEFDQAALKQVRTWRFSPARMGSVAISSEVEVPIVFKLNKPLR